MRAVFSMPDMPDNAACFSGRFFSWYKQINHCPDFS